MARLAPVQPQQYNSQPEDTKGKLHQGSGGFSSRSALYLWPGGPLLNTVRQSVSVQFLPLSHWQHISRKDGIAKLMLDNSKLTHGFKFCMVYCWQQQERDRDHSSVFTLASVGLGRITCILLSCKSWLQFTSANA